MDPCKLVFKHGVYVRDYKDFQIWYVLLLNKRHYVVRYMGFIPGITRNEFHFAGHSLKGTMQYINEFLEEEKQYGIY